MSTRRKFLASGSMAAAALIAAKPIKVFGQLNASSLSSDPNRIVILHTQYAVQNENSAKNLVSKIKSTNSQVVVLNASTESLLAGSLNYDATLPSKAQNSQAAANSITVISNYQISKELQTAVKPYRILRKGNVRIGIIGVANHKGTDGLRYRNPLKEIPALATQLKDLHRCNLVVCLSGLGSKTKRLVDDQTLARLSQNVDIIIGRNTQKENSQTIVVLNKNKHEVFINHAGRNQKMLGHIEICFDRNGKKHQVNFRNETLAEKTV